MNRLTDRCAGRLLANPHCWRYTVDQHAANCRARTTPAGLELAELAVPATVCGAAYITGLLLCGYSLPGVPGSSARMSPTPSSLAAIGTAAGRSIAPEFAAARPGELL